MIVYTLISFALGGSVAVTHAKENVTVHRDVPYREIPGVDPNLLSLDIYVPDDADGSNPVMVVYHGGSFVGGDKATSQLIHPKMDYYTELGWVFVSVNYRLTDVDLPIDHPDQVTHPDHVTDAAASIDWLIENIASYNGDPETIILMGFSAGAQLAALVATDDSRLAAIGRSIADISGVICLDGMYDIPLRYDQPPPLPPPVMNLVWGFDLPTQQDMSPRLHVSPGKDIAPMLIVHANLPNNTEQSDRFAETLVANGYSAVTHNAVGLSHSEIGENIGYPCESLTRVIDVFLEDLGLGLPSVYDLDANHRVDIDDLHFIHQYPVDINGDNLANADDNRCLEMFLRRNELEDMKAGRR